MIVDDDPNILRALTTRLTFAGYEVQIAHNAMTALGMLAEYQPSVALLDINMPGVDGLDLAVAMDAQTQAPIEKIFFTASQDGAIRQRAKKLGFSKILDKPFEARELLDMLAASVSATETQAKVSAP